MSVDGILNDGNILRHFVLRNVAEHIFFRQYMTDLNKEMEIMIYTLT